MFLHHIAKAMCVNWFIVVGELSGSASATCVASSDPFCFSSTDVWLGAPRTTVTRARKLPPKTRAPPYGRCFLFSAPPAHVLRLLLSERACATGSTLTCQGACCRAVCPFLRRRSAQPTYSNSWVSECQGKIESNFVFRVHLQFLASVARNCDGYCPPVPRSVVLLDGA